MVVLPGWGDGADEGRGLCGWRGGGGRRLLLVLLFLRLVLVLVLVHCWCEAAGGWWAGVEHGRGEIAMALGCVDGRGVG